VAIERKYRKDVAELVGVTKRRRMLAGFDAPVANLPYSLTSDAGAPDVCRAIGIL
jgi:hypothetical protein